MRKPKELTKYQLSQFASYDNHEAVYEFSHKHFPYIRYFVAVHTTGLGPALGGIRTRSYKKRDDVLDDVLRLSSAMSLKAAYAGVSFGGGKSVLWVDDHSFFQKHEREIFEWVGDCIESLQGRYYGAGDVGTNSEQLRCVQRRTKHVRGLALLNTLDQESGDPISAMTAYGVEQGIRAAWRFAFPGSFEVIRNYTLAVQGCLGKVGMPLTKQLLRAGGNLVVSDVASARRSPDEVRSIVRKSFSGRCEVVVETENTRRLVRCGYRVFVPCAFGGILNEDTLKEMTWRVHPPRLIAGSANNQLSSAVIGRALHENKILYVPDFVINAGGLIACAYEDTGIDHVRFQVGKMYQKIDELLTEAEKEKMPPFQIAEQKAKEVLCRKAIGLTA